MTLDFVRVDLAGRSYDIKIGQGLLQDSARHIAPFLKRKFVAVVTDENVAVTHLITLQNALTTAGIDSQPIVMPAGEATKSYNHFAVVCDGLLGAGVERKDIVIALGGGVIGDLTGFAAATLRRGVDFIQIPTTLLAQVDSSVGGKTGINSKHGKNLIGAFHQPLLVLADLDILNTLPQRHRASGYAEIVKYGLLGDRGFYDWLDENVEAIIAGDVVKTQHAVKISCQTKARIVAEDETETGLRALLNLGHTFGHALEAATGYSDKLLHGEAVAIGMVQAFGFSEMVGHCEQGLYRKVAAHLRRAGLPTHVSDIAANLPPPNDLLKLMYQDKKAEGGKLTFVLANAIGNTFIQKGVEETKVLTFLKQDIAKNRID